MKKIVAGLAVAAALFAAPAVAADMARPAPVIIPPPSKADWTGAYAGVHAGYAWGNRDGSIDVLFPPVSIPFDYKQKGYLLGGQAGFNWQIAGPLVLGAEVEGSAANIEGDAYTISIGQFNGSGNGTYNWLASGSLKAGLAWNNFLIYAKGGISIAGFEYNSAFGGLGCNFTSTTSGFNYGGGVEVKLTNNVSMKAEYQRIELDNDSSSCSLIYILPAASNNNGTLDIAKVGFNYHFK